MIQSSDHMLEGQGRTYHHRSQNRFQFVEYLITSDRFRLAFVLQPSHRCFVLESNQFQISHYEEL